MATQTPYLSLVLMQTGENVGTWGIPLNQNFQTIDTIAGEIINARGSNSNVSERFGVIDTELVSARGTFSNLNDRLNYLINPDGTSRIENYAKATSQTFGVVRLSKPSSDTNAPVVVETTDTRLLSQAEKTALTTGTITHIHKHYLSDIADVTATAVEVSQALQGIAGTVTSANLNTLTGGGVVPKSLMTVPPAAYGFTGIASLSTSPVESDKPIAVGTNDTRMLSQTQKDELTSGTTTQLHKHKLADGASDLTVTAVELNRLAGASARVNASNLDVLTGGENTTLHTHDTRYYPRAEVDQAIETVEQRVTQKISDHSTSDAAHENANLRLGNITAKGVSVTEKAGVVQIRAHAEDSPTLQKFQVKDNSGLTVASIDASGTLHAKKIVVDVQEVKETQVTKNKSTVTSQLEVQGNTILGDDASADTLVVNTITSEFKGAVTVDGALTVVGTVNGINLATVGQENAAIKAEVKAARGDSSNLKDKITAVQTGLEAQVTALKNARNNPNVVTITQAVAADDGTDITVQQLETLSDGSSADALHTHKKYDDVFNAAKTSSIYGQFDSLVSRLEAGEQKINDHSTELLNARNGKASVDARLDEVDAANTQRDSQIKALQTQAETITSDATTVRNKVSTIEGTIASQAQSIVALTAADVVINQDITTLKNNFTSVSGAQTAILTRVGQAETRLTGHDDALKGKVQTVDASTSVARKQVINDVAATATGNVVSQTKFIDQALVVYIYDQSNGQIMGPENFDVFTVTMNGSVAQVTLRTKSTVGAKTLRLVIIG